MLSGRLSAAVEFENVLSNLSCGLIVGYDVGSAGSNQGLGGMVQAGIGNPGMFYISEWVPAVAPDQPSNLVTHAATGNRANLKPSVRYQMAVTVQGSDMSLSVNGVDVAEARLPSRPVKRREVGLFCQSTGKITIRDFRAEAAEPQAFIVMQFSSPYNEVYSSAIKGVCTEMRISPVRADEIYGPGIIIQDVIDRIARSQLVIADITPPNQNVYFEVGYALALGKPIILLARTPAAGDRLPFDLSGFRVLFYEDSIGGKPMLEAGLRRHLQEILGTE